MDRMPLTEGVLADYLLAEPDVAAERAKKAKFLERRRWLRATTQGLESDPPGDVIPMTRSSSGRGGATRDDRGGKEDSELALLAAPFEAPKSAEAAEDEELLRDGDSILEARNFVEVPEQVGAHCRKQDRRGGGG